MAALGDTILLASTSPRRASLLEEAGIAFERVAPGPEPAGRGAPSLRAVERAMAKALGADVKAGETRLVLGVDTVVVLDGRELGKPADAASARQAIRSLAGRTHHVVTAHCLHSPLGSGTWTGVACATVRFAALDDRAVDAFVAGGSWRGKAGGYGIQDEAAAFAVVERGRRDTVVGLSFATLQSLIREARP